MELLMFEHVLKYFYEISSIPRPSNKEEKIRQYLVDWSEKNDLNYKIDTIWNLVVYIPSTDDKIWDETIILQSHIDMVCVKSEWYEHNFETDWLKLIEENWFIRALNTTLWADNGIWMAMMMASMHLESHPNLELIFTIDEEVGFSWVLDFDASLVSWRKIINLDTEDFGDVCISSAWWARIYVDWPLDFKTLEINKYKITISGMKWWHSWADIDKNRGNAVYFWFEFFNSFLWNFEIAEISWWTADNVIPSSSYAILWIEDLSDFEENLKNFVEIYKQNYDCLNLVYHIEKLDIDLSFIENKWKLISSILWVNSGIYSMSDSIEWLVNTSINLWILKLLNWNLHITYLARSSINSELDELIENVKNNYEKYWLEVNINSRYPWWQENPDNEIVQTVFKSYQKYCDNPKIVAYHAWLECWILTAKISDWCQAVSIWPTITWAHTIEEKVEISSIQIVCLVLEDILKN